MKNTGEQRVETCRAGPNTGVSVLVELGCSTLSTPRCVHQIRVHIKHVLEALQILESFQIFMKSSSCRHD